MFNSKKFTASKRFIKPKKHRDRKFTLSNFFLSKSGGINLFHNIISSLIAPVPIKALSTAFVSNVQIIQVFFPKQRMVKTQLLDF